MCVGTTAKVTLNSYAHAQSIRHEYNYSCIAGNGNGVRGSLVFWCTKLCKERILLPMPVQLYDHWWSAMYYKLAGNLVCS